jgi:MFS family permease
MSAQRDRTERQNSEKCHAAQILMDGSDGPPSRRKGFFSDVPSRVRWLVYLSSFTSVAYGYLIIVISGYFPEIGFKGKQVGLLLGLNGLVFVLSAVPIGILSDRKGRKGILLVGLFALAPVMFVYAFTKEFSLLLVASIFGGVAEGAFMACWNAMIADQTTLTNRNEAFALSFIVGNASFGVGMALPFIFPAITDSTGMTSEAIHNWAFVLMGVLCLISPALLWRLLKNYKEELKPGKALILKESKGPLLKFSTVNSIIGLGAGFIIPLIPTWFVLKFSVPDVYTGPLLALSNITIALSAVVSARLARRYGMIQAIVLTQGLSTVFMLSLAFAQGAVLAGALYLVRAALMNMSSPIADSFLMSIISKEERGFASAINSIVWRLPNSASTIVGGALLDAGSYKTPFFLATGFYVTAIILLYVLFRHAKLKG